MIVYGQWHKLEDRVVIERFSTRRKYEILCKMFIPKTGTAQTVVVGFKNSGEIETIVAKTRRILSV